jgi:hypothetical protein
MNSTAALKYLVTRSRLSIYLNMFLVLFTALIIIGTFGYKVLSDTGDKNLYAHQADAFLKGRFDIQKDYYDVARYEGHLYVPFPPFPAVMLVPLVALFGVASTKTVLVSIALSVLNAAVLTQILQRLRIEPRHIPWIVAAFLLGTGYWLCALYSRGVWFFAHIVSVTCLLLAISESLSKGRGTLVGFFLGMAFLSRQLTLYTIFFFCVALWENTRLATTKEKAINILMLLCLLGMCVIAYSAFNWARFGNPFDTGYEYIRLTGFRRERVEKFGLFSPVYVPFNFINMFIQGFHINFNSSMHLTRIQADPFGTSITFASPFVFAAFWSKWEKKLLWSAWLSIFLMIAHSLFYYNNGWNQPNAHRFMLDYLPVLILMVALGIKELPERLWKATIVYSIALNVLALFGIPLLNRIGL